MKSRFITLKPSGARIQVVEAGKGKDLLFLHGAGGHMVNDPLIAALATKYRVTAPLLPGYGQSSGEDDLRDMLDVTLHSLDHGFAPGAHMIDDVKPALIEGEVPAQDLERLLR